MTELYFTFSLVLILSFLEFGKYFARNKELSLFVFASLVLILSLLSGFRVGVKPDYYNYLFIFEQIENGFDFLIYNYFKIEIGYIIINELFVLIDAPFHAMLLFVSTCSVFLTLKAYRYFTHNFVLATLLYFSFLYIIRDMGAIRAGLSYSILLYSLTFLVDKRRCEFIFFVCLAYFIHNSAILFLVLIGYLYVPVNWRTISILLIGGFFLYFSGLSSFLIEVVGNGMGNGYVGDKVNDYTKESIYNYELGLTDITNLKNLLISITLIYLVKKRFIQENKKILLVSVFVFGASIRVAFSDFAVIAGRTAGIFTTVEPLVLVFILESSRNLRNRTFIYFFLIAYAMATLILGLYKYETFEYKSILG